MPVLLYRADLLVIERFVITWFDSARTSSASLYLYSYDTDIYHLVSDFSTVSVCSTWNLKI